MDVLYVPVSVQALVAGQDGQRVKNMRPSFSVLERMPVGSAVNAAPDDVTVLKAGIHLHWTMPDSLLHGAKNGEEVEFPILPDRWVIQRLEKKGNEIERKVWQIASNAVHLFDPDEEYGNSSVTIPMYGKSDGVLRPCGPIPPGKSVPKPYGYLGHCEPLTLEGTFPEPKMTVPLTAVGWGDPQFAAAYQKCASCFGFWDEVEEEKETQYTYVVCGFYARQEEDPLNERDSMEKLSWIIADGTKGVEALRTVCHGTVCSVVWPGTGVRVKSGVPEGEAEISVGNNSAEALAALLQGHSPGERGMERLLLYHQQDLWEQAVSGGADELLDAEEDSYRRQFSDVFNGYRYELERTDEKQDFDSLRKEDYLGLEKLNELQDRLERMRVSQESYAQKLYIFWCRYLHLKESIEETDAGCEEELAVCLREMKDASSLSIGTWKEAETLEAEVLAFSEALQEQIAGEDVGRKFRVVKKERERGYQPNPPVIAVHGAGVCRSYRQGYQEDEDGKLPCRTKTVDQVTASQDGRERSFRTNDARQCITEKPACMPEFCESVALETVLLEEYFRDVLWMRCLQEDIQDADVEIKEMGGEETGGIPPISFSFQAWSQPWNPLELVWEVSIEPIIRQFDEEDILRNFSLGDIDFWRKENKAGVLEKFSVSGSTLLAPHGAYVMSGRLKALAGENHPLILSVERQETLSQQMEGFYENCLGRRDSLEIPVYWSKWKEKETGISLEELQRGIRGTVFEPEFEKHSEYLPIRSGVGRITKLWIVDSFGQIKEVQTWEKQAKIHIAESLSTGEQKKFLLTPRFLNGCALTVRWISAREGLKDAVTPETTPVCGFVRPDLINKSITFYDNVGNALGSMESAGSRCHFTPFSEEIESFENFSDTVLREFARRFSEDCAALREFLNYLGRHFSDCPGEDKDFYQRCFGKVLALARISVNVSAVGDYDRHIRKEDGGDAMHYVTNGYERCRFQVRMGDERRNQEGLAGFFLLKDEHGTPDMSFMQASNLSASPSGGRFIRDENEWEHSLESPPQPMVLLFDPFSEIKVRTGLLPARVLKLEEYFFRKPVEKMETVFPVRPFLTPASCVQMPLPQSESGKWKWVPADSKELEEEISAPEQNLYSGRKKIREGYVKLPKGENR